MILTLVEALILAESTKQIHNKMAHSLRWIVANADTYNMKTKLQSEGILNSITLVLMSTDSDEISTELIYFYNQLE